ncbi:glycosyltransferase family 2 protein [Pinirhizobacter sp.]|uniref:glycosyltransferase family 2 protein n=1 Tax=Pinirhizobacter sp. TaxID=2950432 RepID=UPI002F406E8B
MSEVVALLLHFRNAVQTHACVLSLLREGVDRLVVVDNSGDGGTSLAALKTMSGVASSPIFYMEPDQNLGFSRGINAGMAFISSRWTGASVLVINNDAVLSEGSLEKLRGAVIGVLPVIAAPRIQGPYGVVSPKVFYRHLSATLRSKSGSRFEHALLGGACLMVHSSLCTADFFDETFFFYGDDIELSHRMAARGVALVEVPGALLVHEGSASSRMGSLFYEYHMARAHLLVTGRLGYRLPGRLGLLVCRVFTLAARAFFRSIRFGSMKPWKGLIMAWWDFLRGQTRALNPAQASTSKQGES